MTTNIAIIGHVDHGKSTLIGRLLLDTGSLPKGKISELRKISRELGKGMELAFLTDQLREEREEARTIDTAQVFFRTRKRAYAIIDAPGHAAFVKNMVTGASLAHAAVLVVDAERGVEEGTSRHAYIIRMLGMKDVVVAVNKMDLVGYQARRFDEVSLQVKNLFDRIGAGCRFILPVSAKNGENVLKPSASMRWFRGPTLVKALDSLDAAKSRKRPLRFVVQDVYEVGDENIMVGVVASGALKAGQEIAVFPSGVTSRIRAVRVFGEERKEALEGENTGLVLEGDFRVDRGDVIAEKNDAPMTSARFKGSLLWLSKAPLKKGSSLTLRCLTQEAACVVEEIAKRLDPATLKVLAEKAGELEANEAGIVTFKTEKPLIVEKFSFIQRLGRFALEAEGELKGAGIIV
jgi:small GTP-binding protein